RAIARVEHLAVGRGLGAALSVEVSAGQERSVEGPTVGDREHCRVRASRLRSGRPIEEKLNLSLPTVEIEIFPRLCEFIEPLYRRYEIVRELRRELEAAGMRSIFGEPRRDILGQLLNGRSFDNVVVVRSGRNDESPVFGARRMFLTPLVPNRDENE